MGIIIEDTSNTRLRISLPCWMRALRVIPVTGSINLTGLYKKTEMSYSHIQLLKTNFELNNWITVNRGKRKHLMTLTKKGAGIVLEINNLFSLLGIPESSIKQSQYIKYINELNFVRNI